LNFIPVHGSALSAPLAWWRKRIHSIGQRRRKPKNQRARKSPADRALSVLPDLWDAVVKRETGFLIRAELRLVVLVKPFDVPMAVHLIF
jgi:hypothetical protein